MELSSGRDRRLRLDRGRCTDLERYRLDASRRAPRGFLLFPLGQRRVHRHPGP